MQVVVFLWVLLLIIVTLSSSDLYSMWKCGHTKSPLPTSNNKSNYFLNMTFFLILWELLKRYFKFITSCRSLVDLFVRKLEVIWVSRFVCICSYLLPTYWLPFGDNLVLYYFFFFFFLSVWGIASLHVLNNFSWLRATVMLGQLSLEKQGRGQDPV